jgi:hypothetical protein
MKFLAEDETTDLPKAGWKGYTISKRDGGEVSCALPINRGLGF